MMCRRPSQRWHALKRSRTFSDTAERDAETHNQILPEQRAGQIWQSNPHTHTLNKASDEGPGSEKDQAPIKERRDVCGTITCTWTIWFGMCQKVIMEYRQVLQLLWHTPAAGQTQYVLHIICCCTLYLRRYSNDWSRFLTSRVVGMRSWPLSWLIPFSQKRSFHGVNKILSKHNFSCASVLCMENTGDVKRQEAMIEYVHSKSFSWRLRWWYNLSSPASRHGEHEAVRAADFFERRIHCRADSFSLILIWSIDHLSGSISNSITRLQNMRMWTTLSAFLSTFAYNDYVLATSHLTFERRKIGLAISFKSTSHGPSAFLHHQRSTYPYICTHGQVESIIKARSPIIWTTACFYQDIYTIEIGWLRKLLQRPITMILQVSCLPALQKSSDQNKEKCASYVDISDHVVSWQDQRNVFQYFEHFPGSIVWIDVWSQSATDVHTTRFCLNRKHQSQSISLQPTTADMSTRVQDKTLHRERDGTAFTSRQKGIKESLNSYFKILRLIWRSFRNADQEW